MFGISGCIDIWEFGHTRSTENLPTEQLPTDHTWTGHERPSNTDRLLRKITVLLLPRDQIHEPVLEKTNNFGFQTSLYSHGSRLEAWNFWFKKKRDCTICVAKIKALISFAVTAKLACAFVFAYADCWFSHAKAHMKKFRARRCSVIFNIYILSLTIKKEKYIKSKHDKSWVFPNHVLTIVNSLFLLGSLVC